MKKTLILCSLILIALAMVSSNYAQPSSVLMNEIYSRGTVAAPDWIEIYNGTSVSVDISGYKIYDSGGQAGTKPKMEIASGTVIPAKGFYVIVTDILLTINPAGFGLSSGGETVWLENAAGSLIDTVKFSAMDSTQSYSRIPDGGEWQLVNMITRGSNNSPVMITALMNEIYSRGTVDAPDWIEIYNGSSAEMDISGYKIYDSGGQAGTKPKMEIASGTVIPAKGFYVIVTDIVLTINPAGFGLSSGGETVWLENAAGNLIDTVKFSAMDATQSYSRIPDGGEWQLVNTITRSSSNSPVMITALMNEIYSRGTVDAPDWIEIYNGSSAEMDISGYKIYDTGGQAGTKPKMEIASGTVIPAKGFFVIVTDIVLTINPAGFGLSSGGETVWLENAGGSLIDTVKFSAMDATQSYSRIPDGGEWQLVNTITRGASNGGTGLPNTNTMTGRFRLEQNYPNPFNPSTNIAYTLTTSGYVKLAVYDVLGRELVRLVDRQQSAGTYTISFNASSFATGLYFYQLESAGSIQTRKMALTK